MIEQTNHVVFARCVNRHWFSATARFTDRPGDLRDVLRRPAGDEHMIAFGRKASAQGCAQPTLGADPHNDAGGRAHGLTSVRLLAISSASSPVTCISRTMSQPPTKFPFR